MHSDQYFSQHGFACKHQGSSVSSFLTALVLFWVGSILHSHLQTQLMQPAALESHLSVCGRLLWLHLVAVLVLSPPAVCWTWEPPLTCSSSLSTFSGPVFSFCTRRVGACEACRAS